MLNYSISWKGIIKNIARRKGWESCLFVQSKSSFTTRYPYLARIKAWI